MTGPRTSEKTARKARRARHRSRRAWPQPQDIAERSRMWQALLESEDRYRATFDNSPVGILHASVDDDKILRANPKLSEMLGYTQNELLGMTTGDIVPPGQLGADADNATTTRALIAMAHNLGS